MMELCSLENMLDDENLMATFLQTARLGDGMVYFLYGINGKIPQDMGVMAFPERIGRAAADEEAQALLNETVRRLRLEMSPLKVDGEFTVMDKGRVYGHKF